MYKLFHLLFTVVMLAVIAALIHPPLAGRMVKNPDRKSILKWAGFLLVPLAVLVSITNKPVVIAATSGVNDADRSNHSEVATQPAQLGSVDSIIVPHDIAVNICATSMPYMTGLINSIAAGEAHSAENEPGVVIARNDLNVPLIYIEVLRTVLENDRTAIEHNPGAYAAALNQQGVGFIQNMMTQCVPSVMRSGR